MKKRWSWMILAVVLVVFTALYAVVDKNNGIYDQTVDTSAYLSVGLSQGEELEQTFVSREDRLDGIRVKMTVTGEAEKKKVSYALRDAKGETVAQGETSLGALKAGKFFLFSFDTLEGCQGQEYTFELKAEQCEEDTQIILYAVPGADEAAAFTVGGDKSDSVMVLRTVTHRFDLETFIVTAVFLLYVVAFICWLGRIFK